MLPLLLLLLFLLLTIQCETLPVEKKTPEKKTPKIYNGPMSRKGVTNNIILQYCSISDQKRSDSLATLIAGKYVCVCVCVYANVRKKIAICTNRNIIKINIYVSSENTVCWSFAFHVCLFCCCWGYSINR